MNETLGKILLLIACLYMAGLNLWLLFKEWFNERYSRKQTNGNENKKAVGIGKPKIGESHISIIGESKFNLREVQAQREQQEQNRQPTLTNEQPNPVIHSEHLEKERLPTDNPEEDILLPTAPQNKIDVELQGSQSFTVDEFALMAKSLSGKPITKQEEKEVGQIIPKMQGTDIYRQFIGQVKGAENRAMEILRRAEDNESDSQSGMSNLSKFIRT